MFKTGKSHPYAKYPRVEKEIIRLVVKNPELGSRQIAKRLSEKLSHVQVNSLLKKLGAETYDRRINFGRNYAGPGRLKNDVAHEVVNKCLAGFNVSKLSNEYLVSRDTIYRWLKKYNAGAKLNSNYVVGVNHPKAVYPKFEQQVLDLVSKNPNLTPSKIAKNLPISSYTIWKIFDQNNLNSIAQRNLFAVNHQEIPEQIKSPDFTFSEIKSNNFFQTPNTLPGPPPKENVFFNFWKTLVFTSLTTLPLGLGFLNYQQNYVTGIGTAFATIALFFGGVFFLYSLKYYLTLLFVLSYSPKEKKLTPRNSIENFFFKFTKSSYNSTGIVPDLGGVILEKKPFVSVHVSLFNEKNVVERIVKAVTSFEYPEYEVILADDSTDETVNIIKAFQEKCLFKGEQLKVETYDGYTLTQVEVRPNVYLKHIHRQKRDGFKGAALAIALNHVNPKTEYISIFDADFVPYPDSLNLFLKYFQESRDEKVAVVQGYQWHVLNKSENWITRGVRSEYSGSYVVERSGAEIYGGLKQIAGSVYMIKKDVLSSIGWGRSITEDFELTLRLYEKGYKVLYTPYVQAPAECVSTLTRLIRQRMRWAEGHSFNIKKMFSRLITSPSLTVPEKAELVYLAPYYLQAFFFLIGTFAWLLAETVFKVRLPFWTEVWGWSLILTNMIALPLVNGVGLFLEESEHKDYTGLGSFIMLSYIVVPFQAYAAVKGFIEKEEGPWFRTPKTGRITDILTRNILSRFIPSFGTHTPNSLNTEYLALSSANTKFNSFRINRKKNNRVGNFALVIVLIVNLFLSNLMLLVPDKALAYSKEDVKVFDKSNPKTTITQKEPIKSQIITKFSDGEVMFHKTPRLRYKFSDGEIEIETVAIDGIGKIKNVEPYKFGANYVYPEIFDDTTLNYSISGSSMSESFELEKYHDINFIEQTIKPDGYALIKDGDGLIKIAPKSGGTPKFVFEKPFMYEKDHPEVKSFDISYELIKDGRNYKLRKVLSQSARDWLNNPNRNFPVVIDPTVTDIYTSNISNIDVKFGPNQRKIAYMPNATGGAAWYAFSASDGTTANEVDYNKCLVSTGCDLTSEWSTVPVLADGGSNEYVPNIWVQGDVIWVSWINTTTDALNFRALDTTSDTFQTLASPSTTTCSTASQGTLGNNNFSYIAVGTNGDVLTGYSSTTGDAEADIFQVENGTCTFTSIETGSGLPASSTTMQPVAVAIGNNVHVVYDDAANEIRHSVFDLTDGTDAWSFTDQVADNGNVLNDDFSVTTDGTDLWLFYMDAANSTVLQKCTGTCMTSGAGTWTNLTAPWTSGLTTGEIPAISYFTTDAVLRACVIDGATTTTQDVVCKDTSSGTISWGSQFAIGYPSADLQELSTVMTVPTTSAEQFAMVAGDITNSDFTVATVPENLFFYMSAFPIIVIYIKRRKTQYE